MEKNVDDAFIPIIEDDRTETFNFKIETSMPTEQQQKIRLLLNEFQEVFSSTLGRTHFATHRIKLKDSTPCVRPSYRIPESLKRPFEEEISRLFSAGILRECESDYRSPVIPIRKPDGSLRIVNDFSLLNSRTTDDLYPMSSPNEVLSLAAGKPWISKIDLSKSFLQVPLAEEC